ncbi:MAG: endonuclease [Ruminococcus sp.]|nr:endonuclease [Ruminococcus sp.]
MKRIILFFFISIIVLASIPCAAALGELPAVNEQERHIVCTQLSEPAKEYYTGEYRYDTLSRLSGAADTTDGYAAMHDNALFEALHTLMASTHQYYTAYSGKDAGSLAYFWTSTDAVAGGDTYTMFYADVPSDAPNVKLNREHIWPKSRASFGERKGNGGSDLHHLRPAVDSLNRAKSDHLFGNINGVYTEGVKQGSVNGEVCYWVNTAQDLFECKDDVKGDVARILLYVYCRWEQPNLYTDISEERLPPNDADSTDNGKKVIESLDTLLDWCEEDPVDTWEMRRNDLTESVQGNRNVFIDYPEFAWQLFDREVPENMPTPSSSGERFILGDADGDGAVTSIDVTVIQRHIAQLTVTAFDGIAADVDADERVTILDACYIQRSLAGMEQPYAIGG